MKKTLLSFIHVKTPYSNTMSNQDLPIPKHIISQHNSPTNGTFTWGPLAPGLGNTLGNALRRILISSSRGYAITHVELPQNIAHEFSSIQGVVEDMTTIILNLKKIRLKKVGKGVEEKISVHLKGEDSFLAKALEKASNTFEVMNPDLCICTLEKEVELNFTFTIGEGSGYTTAVENRPERQVLGLVAIDSIFTPVLNVKLRVEPTLVGKRADYESLSMTIITDGTVSPEKALKEAACTLQKHFATITQCELLPQQDHLDQSVKKPQGDVGIAKLLQLPLNNLGLATRAVKVLEQRGWKCLGHLLDKERQVLLDLRNFGQGSFRQLLKFTEENNLSFGMDITPYLDLLPKQESQDLPL